MYKIAIVTDSGSDITKETAAAHQIKIVPLQVLYRDRVWKDRVDVEPDYVLQHLEEEIPKTSLPLRSDVVAVLEELKKEGYTHVLMIHMSSALSGTYQLICNVAEDYRSDFERIEVIDSKYLSMVEGHCVIEAAKEAQRSKDFQKTVDRAKQILKNSIGFFTVDTLRYLKAGGRISRFEGTLASLLDIKPIIGLDEQGYYYPAAKVRGRRRSLSAMLKLVEEKVKDKTNLVVSTVYTGSPAEAKMLLQQFVQGKKISYASVVPIGSSLSVHMGIGGIGICVLWEDEC